MPEKEVLNQEIGVDQVNDSLPTDEELFRQSQEMIKLFNKTALEKRHHPEGLPINMDEFPIKVRRKLKALYAQLYPKGMNIFALNDDKVIFMGTERWGSNEDRDNAKRIPHETERFIQS